LADVSGERVFYVHIGLHYGCPWRPTFSLLVEQEGGGGVLGADYALLKDCQSWMTAVRLAEAMNQSDTWLCHRYHVEDSCRPIARMEPGAVSVRKVSTEAIQVWPRVVVPRRGARPAGGGGGGEDGDDGSGRSGTSEASDGSELSPAASAGSADAAPPLPAPASPDAAAVDDEDDEESIVLEDDLEAVNEEARVDSVFETLLDDCNALATSSAAEDVPPTAAADETTAPAAAASSSSSGRWTQAQAVCIFVFVS